MDIIIVNSVMWAEGWEGVKGVIGAEAKGGAVVTRQGTRVDRNLSA